MALVYRRQFPLALAAFAATSLTAAKLDNAAMRKMSARVVPVDPNVSKLDGVKLDRKWNLDFCRAKVTNAGKTTVAIKEIVLFSIPLMLSPDSALYGESFQMLSQTAGTLGKPVDLAYSELKHYKTPSPRA